MAARIRYLRGDATAPQSDGPAVVAHICNDSGRWGRGFVLAVSSRWPGPEIAYRSWHRVPGHPLFALGAVQLVPVAPNLHVANMIGQHGIRARTGNPPIRYDAVDRCLQTLAEHAESLCASVHMPRIGCGLAGGTWNRIEPLLTAALTQRGIEVTVYDLP